MIQKRDLGRECIRQSTPETQHRHIYLLTTEFWQWQVGTSAAPSLFRVSFIEPQKSSLPHYDTAIEGVEFGLQSGAQQVGENIIARQIYDQYRGELEDVLDATTLATGLGTLTSLITVAATHKPSRPGRPSWKENTKVHGPPESEVSAPKDTDERQSLDDAELLREPHPGLIMALQQHIDVPVPFGTKSIRNTMSNITIVTKCEVALFRMKDGKRVFRLGGLNHVYIGPEVRKIIAHTHPSGTLDFSEADIRALMLRRQSSSVIIDPKNDIAMRLRIKDQLE